MGLYLSPTSLGLGLIEGDVGGSFRDYLYLSIVSYTPLGLRVIYPTGHPQLRVGSKVWIGLMMITWLATFTFLEMKHLWDDTRDAG